MEGGEAAVVPWEATLVDSLCAVVEDSDYDFDVAAKKLRRLIRIEDVRVKTSTRRKVDLFTATACRLKFADLDAGNGSEHDVAEEAPTPKEAPESPDVRPGAMMRPPRLALDAHAEALLASLENFELVADQLPLDIQPSSTPPSNSELAQVIAFLEASPARSNPVPESNDALLDSDFDNEVNDDDEVTRIEKDARTESEHAVKPKSKPRFSNTIRRGTRDEVFAMNSRARSAGSNNDEENDDSSDEEDEQEAWAEMRKKSKSLR
ncbi:Hypothetical Protein FCC1311_007412 [Hondaea fermentalgiana]|uniref:Uncharacterized protein n=1 Tax=Hondaea fermentalgiana TaxID=2315210 RepID=A0A2R5G0H9_9STRA|nr:Hypothetical Protein FCC1311_007412 [Hondaea fermentalgiana]|eukprot:GBG24522.1 Hypothetical Protein FCC1311_007412 [Hondaea fermentalgiana]